MSSVGHGVLVSVLMVAAAVMGAPPAVADASDCTYVEEYVLGQRWTFVCDAGWYAPQLHIVEEVGHDPCFSINQIDESTIEVTVYTVCLDGGTLAVRTAMSGTLYVWE